MPVNVINDTDLWSDFDDALALAMIHALADRGELSPMAVTITDAAVDRLLKAMPGQTIGSQ